MAKKSDDEFTPEQTQKRFEAALRGARVTGHKPMSDVAPKRKTKSASKKKRAPTSSK
jgi:hypothetical protein